MRIALLTYNYPPLRTSAAVQMRDLARKLAELGHEPTVIAPAFGASGGWKMEASGGVQVFRAPTPAIHVGGNIRRALGEAVLPLSMYWGLRQSPLRKVRWDAVIWYSPTIFFGPLVWAMRRRHGCPTYLILRDIFPEWAVDLSLMRKGPAYYFFKVVAALQYAVADTIGVQSPSNAAFLEHWRGHGRRKIEVLHNWLAPAKDIGCSIELSETSLAGRTIFVYIGNMGVAQALDIFLDVAQSMSRREDVGFLFVGRGSELPSLKRQIRERALQNVLLHDEVEPEEIPGLLAQCHVGLVSLDPRHRTHNVPGKFLSYMQAGLPVLARVNPGVDLKDLIETESVGLAFVGQSSAELSALAERLADLPSEREQMSARARLLSDRMFVPRIAAQQLLAALAPRSANDTLSTPGR